MSPSDHPRTTNPRMPRSTRWPFALCPKGLSRGPYENHDRKVTQVVRVAPNNATHGHRSLFELRFLSTHQHRTIARTTDIAPFWHHGDSFANPGRISSPRPSTLKRQCSDRQGSVRFLVRASERPTNNKPSGTQACFLLSRNAPSHPSVCTSTLSTAGRSRTIAFQLSPPSAEA